MRWWLGALELWVLLALGCGRGPAGDAGWTKLGEVEQGLCADGPTVEGIDVSRYQGTLNWSQVKQAGKAFALIQAGRGLSPDPHFSANWAGAKANGLLRGTYLRFFPSQDVTGQANILIQANSGASAAAGDLPPMLDIEDHDGLTPAVLRARVEELVQKVQAGTGRVPLIYTGYYFWKDFVQSTAHGAHPLVIANYGSACPMIPAGWSRWAFHQYSSTGKVAGITGNVDLDRFNGTLADLQALAADSLIVGQPDAGFDAGVTPAEGMFTGAVYQNGDSKSRVEGATVTVQGTQQTTGADGLFRFSLPAGTYTATVDKPGYTSSSVVRTVSPGGTTWGSMNIQPLVGPDAGTTPLPFEAPGISGFTYRTEDGARLTEVMLVLRSVAGEVVDRATSDSDGAFELDLATSPFEGELTASAPGYQTRILTVHLESAERRVMDVGLTPATAPEAERMLAPSQEPGTPGTVDTSAAEGAAGGCTSVPGLGLLVVWVVGPWLVRTGRSARAQGRKSTSSPALTRR